jgi:transposase
VRRQRDPSASRGAGRDAQHPAKGKSQKEELLLAVLYRPRNAIERMSCRLKDFRRVATRYDRTPNFLAAVCIAATSATGYESGR